MNIFTVCAVCLLSVIAVVWLKQYNPTFSLVLGLAACLILMLTAISIFHPLLLSIMDKLSSIEQYDIYFSVVIKCIGICYLSEFVMNICEENNARGLSLTAHLCSRISMIYLCLPFLSDVLSWIEKLMTLQ